MEDSLINYKVENDKETIEISVNNLLEYQENHDILPLYVNDRQKMVKWFEKHLKEVLVFAYEQGEPWVEGANCSNE